jgi:hypothetical protein
MPAIWMRRAIVVVLLSLGSPSAAHAQRDDARTEAERFEALREDASEDERSLLDQAEAALSAMDDPARDEAGRERARTLADAALGVLERRRAERIAHRAREAAEATLASARQTLERARARRARRVRPSESPESP